MGEAYGGPYRDMATQFLHHKVNLKKNIYLHVNSTTHRCSNKILKTSLIEDFIHLTPVLLTLGWCILSGEYLCDFSKILKWA